MPEFGPGGMLWRAAEGRIVWRDARGASNARGLARGVDPLAIAVARGGSPWFTSGALVAPPSSKAWFRDVAVGTVRDSTLAGWSLFAAGRSLRQSEGALPPLTLGGDGALWTSADVSWSHGYVVRVVPPGLRAPRRPVARVTGLLARNGRTVVLQVRCAAERGRFCRGTVGLGASAKAVRYTRPTVRLRT